MLTCPCPTPKASQESGSVAVVVMVLLLGASLAATALSHAQRDLQATGMRTDQTAALAGAEWGLAEAIARLHNGEAAPLDGIGLLPNGSFSYEVAMSDSTTAHVTATGEISDRTSTIRAELTASAETNSLPQHTAFGHRYVEIWFRSSSVEGSIGSSGTIEIHDSSTTTDYFLYGSNGSCSGCSPSASTGPAFVYPEPIMPPGPTRPCPKVSADTTRFSGVLDGKDGVPFVCTTDEYVEIIGVTGIVNPPVLIYLLGYADVEIFNSTIDLDQPAEDFQVFIQSNSTYEHPIESRGDDLAVYYTEVAMVLYAPGRTADIYGSTIAGSVILDQFIQRLDNSHFRASSAGAAGSGEGWSLTNWSTEAQ